MEFYGISACKQNSPALHPIFMKLSKYPYYPSKTTPIENRHGWVISGVLGGVKGVISEWRMTNKAKGFRRVLQLALVKYLSKTTYTAAISWNFFRVTKHFLKSAKVKI